MNLNTSVTENLEYISTIHNLARDIILKFRNLAIMASYKPNSNELIERAKEFFKNIIVPKHIDDALKRASKLESYNINPFIIRYLANFLDGNDSPESIAKALIYPRILGTSMTTIFGTYAQTMISSIFKGLGSTTDGIDIEFFDEIDGRKKYCQIKAGPNTINKDDVTTIKNHFKGIKNLARTNRLDVRHSDLIVGVLYGEDNKLSTHYREIRKEYNVYIGADFWERITGESDFYHKLTEAISEIAIDIDGSSQLENAIKQLASEIENQKI